MAWFPQAIRENLVYASGYLKGRSFNFPTSLFELYGVTVGKVTNLLALPLPFLSFLALPIFGSSSTTVSLVFFYLTWSALVLSHDQLTIELYGTLAVRLLCFVLPAIGFLGFGEYLAVLPERSLDGANTVDVKIVWFRLFPSR
jgi:hypothetical protein